jgi:hypothetical protein
MKISVDTEWLYNHPAIDTEDFLIIYLIHLGEFREAHKLAEKRESELTLDDRLGLLESLGYVKILSDERDMIPLKDVEVRQKFLDIIEDNFNIKWFDELWEAYPYKVPNGRGTFRVLHAKDKNSRDYQVMLRKYRRICTSEEYHRNVISALRTQLQTQTPMYMQGLEVWLNQRTFEKYVDMDTPSIGEML